MCEAESEFSLAAPHLVALHRGGATVGQNFFSEDTSGKRSADIDVFLSGLARRRDLPAKQFAG